MEGEIMKEVDDEINRILNKNKHQKARGGEYCNETNLDICLAEISQEFDFLDVSCMEEPFDLSSKKSLKNILIQLINSSYDLIKFHKDTQKQQRDKFEKNSRLFSDFKALSKTADILRKELASKDRQLQINKDKIVLNQIENTELKNKIKDTKIEMNTIQKEMISENNRHKHEINKAVNDSKILQERFKKNCGTYVSKEGHIVEVLEKYKKNEEKHLNMIQQLQENNHLLLEEILVLKGELSAASFKHRNK